MEKFEFPKNYRPSLIERKLANKINELIEQINKKPKQKKKKEDEADQ